MSIFDQLAEGLRQSPLGIVRVKTVMYTPHSGDAAELTGVWNPGQTLPEFYADGEQEVALGVLRLDPDDVTNPDDRDSVTIDSVTWAVKSIGRHDPILELQLETRDQRVLGGANARIQR